MRNSTVAVLVGEGYEELEFWYPVLRFREAGHRVDVVSLSGADLVSGRRGYPVVPNSTLADYRETRSVVIIPGSRPEDASRHGEVLGETLRHWLDAGAVVGASGTGASILASAGVLDDSGALGDAPVVTSGPLTMARSVDNVPAMLEAILGEEPTLQGITAAVLCENQYQELELWYPLLRLRAAGARAYTVGPKAGAMYTSKLGYPVVSDIAAGDVDASDFDAVIIPGGHSPEGMRRSAEILDLVRKADGRGAIVAAICHAGWVLASAGIAKGRHLTCVGVIRDDVIHAGGDYVNEEVVRDGNLITSRLPSDLPVFAAKVVEALREVTPSAGRASQLPEPTSGPSYDRAAKYVPLAVGVASADYTQVAAPL